MFAPTNDAFDALAVALNTDLNGILALPNLADVLLYHVVDGFVASEDLTNGPVTTLSGTEVTVDLTSGVMINNSNVTTPDVFADNGIVHLVDAVIGLPDVVTFAVADPTFSTLVAALTRDDLTTDFVGVLSTPTGTSLCGIFGILERIISKSILICF